MVRVEFAVLAFLLVASAAYGQTGTPIPPASVAEDSLYRAVLNRVFQQEKWGDRIAAQGRDSSNVRSMMRKQAALTASEDATLKDIAKRYYAAETAFFAQRTKVLRALKEQAGAGHALDPAKLAELAELERQFKATTVADIAELKSAFGTERFKAFDAFVRATILPHIKVYRQRSPSRVDQPAVTAIQRERGKPLRDRGIPQPRAGGTDLQLNPPPPVPPFAKAR